MQRTNSASTSEDSPTSAQAVAVVDVVDAATKKDKKERAKRVLNDVWEVVLALKGLAEFNPYAKGCVATLEAMIQLELKRRENDEEVVTVFRTMSKMAENIQYLKPYPSQDTVFATRLQATFTDIETDMNKFGEFRIKYYRTATLSRIIRATENRARLDAFRKTFVGHQAHLVAVLTARTTVATQEILDRMPDGRRTLDDPFSSPSDSPNVSEDVESLRLNVDEEDVDEFEQELKEAKEELEAGQLRWDAEKSGEDLGFTSLGDSGIDELAGDVATREDAALEVSENMRQIEMRLESMGLILDRMRLAASKRRSSSTPATSALRRATASTPPATPPPAPPAPILRQPSPLPPVWVSRPPPPPPAQLAAPIPPPPAPPAAAPSSSGRKYTALLNNVAMQQKRQLVIQDGHEGPDHNRIWTITVKIDGAVKGLGVAPKKGDAKEEAARQACKVMGWVLG